MFTRLRNPALRLGLATGAIFGLTTASSAIAEDKYAKPSMVTFQKPTGPKYVRWNFESRLIAQADLEPGHQRMWEVDNALVIPIHTNVELLLTSVDVIHSFYIQALGEKIDCNPGILTTGHMFIKKPGIMYGQCAELCGVNHSRMPIVIRAIPNI